MNSADTYPDIRGKLAAERHRVVRRADSVRRQATASLALMTLVFAVGASLVGALIHAEQTISRLNSVTETRARLIDRIGYRSGLVLQDEFRRSVPPEFVRVLVLEYDEYFAQDRRLQAETAAALAEARGVPTRYFTFVSSEDLGEFEASVVNRQLLDTARRAPSNLAAEPGGPLTDDELALQSALTSHEFSAPAEHAEIVVQHMVDEGRRGTTMFTIIVAVATALMLALLWVLAFWPAIRSYHEILDTLDHQASEIERSFARAAAAQRIARLGYWYQSGPGDAIECSDELAEMLTADSQPAPTTLAELASLTSGTDAHKTFATYRRLEIEPGEAEMTHVLSIDGQPDLTLRERVESFTTGGTVRLGGAMLDISDIAAAQQVILRMEKFEIVELLISGVAHDFNNLLGIITGNAELALDTVGPPVDRHLTAIVDASIAAAGLIGQLRQTALDPLAVAEKFVVADALRRVISSLSIPANISVTLTIDERAASATVVANRGVFESSIVNLVKNAIEAIGPSSGRIQVELSTAADLANGSQDRSANILPSGPHLRGRQPIRVAVTDDGAGMSDQVRGRALQPFFTTKGRGHGNHMGLGLWSVYSFAKAWDGAVKIHSTQGLGTEVTIELPAAAPEERSDPAKSSLPPFAGNPRVLLVEDIGELLAIGDRTLRGWGLDVVPASGFDEAVRILGDCDDLRLLITDVRLGPDTTGFELALRAIQRDPPLGVVVVSGAFDAEDLPDGLDQPLCRFLAKPFERESLHQAVDRLLDLTSQSSPA